MGVARFRRRLAGRGKIGRWLGRAARTVGHFVRSNHLISRGAAALGSHLGGPAGSVLSHIGIAAGSVGLGRRRYRGGALRLAGAGTYRRRRVRLY
jgi:hypothetical protein